MRVPALTAAALILAASATMFAHHGTAAFDVSKMVTVEGKITDFQYVNPHVQVFFEGRNEKGEMAMWQGELTAPNKLTRAGWNKNTLKPGDSVIVTGNVTKNGANTIWIRKMIGPKGEVMQLFED